MLFQMVEQDLLGEFQSCMMQHMDCFLNLYVQTILIANSITLEVGVIPYTTIEQFVDSRYITKS